MNKMSANMVATELGQNKLSFNKNITLNGTVGEPTDFGVTFLYTGEPAILKLVPNCSCTVVASEVALQNGVNIIQGRLRAFMQAGKYDRTLPFQVIQDGKVVFTDKILIAFELTSVQ